MDDLARALSTSSAQGGLTLGLHVNTELFELQIWRDEGGTRFLELEVLDAPWEADSHSMLFVKPGQEFLPIPVFPGSGLYGPLPMHGRYFSDELQALEKARQSHDQNRLIEDIYLTLYYYLD